jgi:hypothetical protein
LVGLKYWKFGKTKGMIGKEWKILEIIGKTY